LKGTHQLRSTLSFISLDKNINTTVENRNADTRLTKLGRVLTNMGITCFLDA
jgi:hypothetical protein